MDFAPAPRPSSSEQLEAAPSIRDVFFASAQLMGQLEQYPSFRGYLADHGMADVNKTDPYYWATVADFAYDNRRRLENAFGSKGASIADLVFATPDFLRTQALVNEGRVTETASLRDSLRRLSFYHDLVRTVILEHPSLDEPTLRNGLAVAAQRGWAHSQKAMADINGTIRGVQAELTFEALTNGLTDMVVERADVDTDVLDGGDYVVKLPASNKAAPYHLEMLVDIKAGPDSFAYAISKAAIVSRVKGDGYEYAIVRYPNGNMKMILRPLIMDAAAHYNFRLPEDVIERNAPNIHRALLTAARVPGVCRKAA